MITLYDKLKLFKIALHLVSTPDLITVALGIGQLRTQNPLLGGSPRQIIAVSSVYPSAQYTISNDPLTKQPFLNLLDI